MRIVIQVVKNASVKIDGQIVSEINKGELLLVSFKIGDDEKIVDKMIDKLLKLRIFADENGKTNLNISSINGEILAVSQFTLYACLNQGNRPAFTNCMPIDQAKELYNYFCVKLSSLYSKVKFGVFQADMQVSLVNDGPFTIIMDSKELDYE